MIKHEIIGHDSKRMPLFYVATIWEGRTPVRPQRHKSPHVKNLLVAFDDHINDCLRFAQTVALECNPPSPPLTPLRMVSSYYQSPFVGRHAPRYNIRDSWLCYDFCNSRCKLIERKHKQLNTIFTNQQMYFPQLILLELLGKHILSP